MQFELQILNFKNKSYRMGNKNEPKGHHYISNFYLKHFADDKNKIHIYDREKNEYRYQSTDKVAKINNYYTLYNEHGEKDLKIEKMFGDIESNTQRIYKKIHKGKLINKFDKVYLATFVTFLLTRTPEFEISTNLATDKISKNFNEAFFKTLESTKKYIAELEKKENRKIDIDAEKLFKLLNNPEFKFGYDRKNMISYMIEITLKLLPHLLSRNWIIAHSIDYKNLITSDNPFILISNSAQRIMGRGVLSKNVTRMIPLSSSHCLTIHDYGKLFTSSVADEQLIDVFNRFTAIDCNRYLFAERKEILEKVVNEIKLNEWKKR